MTKPESYLVFGLRSGLYAIALREVQQIIRLKGENFTQKGLIRGEIRYKGHLLPLMDLCFLFRQQHLLSMGEGIVLAPPKACFIVENVLDVWENITPLPLVSESAPAQTYFQGTLTMQKQIVLILNISDILKEVP